MLNILLSINIYIHVITYIEGMANINNKEEEDIITLDSFAIDRAKAIAQATKTKTLPFFNPADDFIGIIECYDNIRHIEKHGNMKQDLNVIDCKIIVGSDTREEEVETKEGKFVKKVTKKYKDEECSLVLTKSVLLTKFTNLEKEQDGLAGKRFVIVGLGRVPGKNYYDYYVAPEEEAIQEGILINIKAI